MWISFSWQLPGVIALTNKIVPTIMNLLKKLAETGQVPATGNRNTRMGPTLGPTTSDLSSVGSSQIPSEDETEFTSPLKQD